MKTLNKKIPPVWNLFRRCCLAFPSLSDKNSNYNVLTSLIQKNFDFNTGKDETVYRFSSSYDGTATPSAQYANFFKQYDIKKADWSTWAETDKNFSYGWFSESGLRSQALVNWASESNKTSVNYFGSPTVLYHNQIYTNKVDAFFFQYAAFTFDTVDRVHSGGLYIIYMLISGLLLYVGYNQYVKHDFQ